jgi:hypothetical protein
MSAFSLDGNLETLRLRQQFLIGIERRNVFAPRCTAVAMCRISMIG